MEKHFFLLNLPPKRNNLVNKYFSEFFKTSKNFLKGMFFTKFYHGPHIYLFPTTSHRLLGVGEVGFLE